MKSLYNNINKMTETLIKSTADRLEKADRRWQDSWTRNKKEVRVITVDGVDAVLMS